MLVWAGPQGTAIRKQWKILTGRHTKKLCLSMDNYNDKHFHISHHRDIQVENTVQVSESAPVKVTNWRLEIWTTWKPRTHIKVPITILRNEKWLWKCMFLVSSTPRTIVQEVAILIRNGLCDTAHGLDIMQGSVYSMLCTIHKTYRIEMLLTP